MAVDVPDPTTPDDRAYYGQLRDTVPDPRGGNLTGGSDVEMKLIHYHDKDDIAATM